LHSYVPAALNPSAASCPSQMQTTCGNFRRTNSPSIAQSHRRIVSLPSVSSQQPAKGSKNAEVGNAQDDLQKRTMK